MRKYWLLLKKQEMTKVWIDDNMVVVTLLKLIPQEIVRYKTQEKDWYLAAVVWTWKKVFENKEKWVKEKYAYMTEFKVDEQFIADNEAWKQLDLSLLEWVEKLYITWTSKWKWFQWVIKRHWFAWWPASHGSKFHREPGSIGNRKPRRVNKWHPLPGHMWSETVTLKNVPVIEKMEIDWETFVAVKWSVPGHYNSILKVYLK